MTEYETVNISARISADVLPLLSMIRLTLRPSLPRNPTRRRAELTSEANPNVAATQICRQITQFKGVADPPAPRPNPISERHFMQAQRRGGATLFTAHLYTRWSYSRSSRFNPGRRATCFPHSQ
jgi:hypothetical protein